MHVIPAGFGWEAFALEITSLYWPLPALLRPALHVVPAGFGWEAFALETTSLLWPLHALLRPALHVVPAGFGWEAFALETTSLFWPLPALLRLCPACHMLARGCVDSAVDGDRRSSALAASGREALRRSIPLLPGLKTVDRAALG